MAPGADRVRLAAAALGAICALALAGGAHAQRTDGGPECGLLCSVGAEPQLLRRLQAPTIDTLGQSGPAYRALAVDAWGRPMPAITFTRDGAGAPQVEVRVIPSDASAPIPLVRRWPISQAHWDQAVAAVEGLPPSVLGYRRESKARTETGPNGEPGVIVTCADGWSYRVEWTSGGVATAVSGLCHDPVGDAYDRLAAIALAESPHCAIAGSSLSPAVIECLASHPAG